MDSAEGSTTGNGLSERLVARLEDLLDRSDISDMIVAYGRALDEKDWDGYAALFTDDAELEFPFMEGEWARSSGGPGLAEKVARGLRGFHITHHMMTNQQVWIDGDTARSTSYLHSVHVRKEGDEEDHWDLGGWHHCEYRRTPDGWRFTKVRLESVWQSDGISEIGQG